MARNKFPGYWYSPEGDAKIFDDFDAVPAGWADQIRSFDDKGKPVKGANVKAASKAAPAKGSKGPTKKSDTPPAETEDTRTDDELKQALIDNGFEVEDDVTRADMLAVLNADE